MHLKKLCWLAAMGIFLSLPAQALSSRDFKPYLGEFDFYSSHARHGDIALLSVGDEGASFAYIVNLKTKRRFKIRHHAVQPNGNIDLIFFADDFGGQPEASGIQASDLKNIKVEFRYLNGACQRYGLTWSARDNAYLLSEQGRGKCFLKTNR
ncbi:MAG: hypothetical protein ACO1RX_04580 [Candidatus Sericytochromatia bacterium]